MTEVIDQALAELIDRSDERDLYETRIGQAFREGYHVGHEAGYEAGYGQAATDWLVTAGGMTNLGGQTFAELDRRRYPPGGRLSWIRLRPGERCVHQVARVPCPDNCKSQERAS